MRGGLLGGAFMVAAGAGRKRWDKFFWADWENDAALAMCSMAAQGFWMRLLCLCANSDGQLLIGGRKPSAETLAHYTRQTVADVEIWLDELGRHGVFSRTRGGVIFSRRMRDDREKHERNRENGSKGGNPALISEGKHIGKSGSDNPPDNQPLKAEAEAEAEADKDSVASAPPKPTKAARKKLEPWDDDPHFVELWSVATPAMRRRGKSQGVVWAEWRPASERTPPTVIVAALRRYLVGDPDVGRTGGPGLQRWLKDRVFEQWAAPAAAEQVDR